MKTKRKNNTWTVPTTQLKQFDLEIHSDGGIDYAELCLQCLNEADQAENRAKMEKKGFTTKQVSKGWRSNSSK